MKSIILALALLVAPMVASANHSAEYCMEQATIVFFAAQGRDFGSEPSAIVKGLVREGNTLEQALLVVQLVFGAANMAPNEIAISYFNYCTSEDA